MHKLLPFVALLAFAEPVAAKDSLGVFGEWGAFRDPQVPRCYAIAKPAASRLRRDYEPFASVGTWPRRNIRGQVHFRMSREIDGDRPITLTINDRRFTLTGGGGDAWAKDQAMDAAIVAAMRSGARMVVGATGTNGRRFSNSYDLDGAATALDAATVGCAQR
ncbi:invasion associated locus B family protein [Erythrobacter litoralis]|uniref:Mlr4354 like protein n=1 Tax=Erythrobacter litoralis (strain HTCC2594) TaxID=314225 RepID=Q2N9J4_ERYLH|nr:invasion associated locus B family protein [Erythrobacter litoralis]ABC63647.1 hypothetical protein ELI_07775 [Erythrobacter litoralis HTCC2594]